MTDMTDVICETQTLQRYATCGTDASVIQTYDSQTACIVFALVVAKAGRICRTISSAAPPTSYIV